MIEEKRSTTPTVNTIWMSQNSGSSTACGWGMNVVTTNSTTSAPSEIAVSTSAVETLPSGKTSRGQYTLFSRWVLLVRLFPPAETDVEKKPHGMRPRYEKSA